MVRGSQLNSCFVSFHSASSHKDPAPHYTYHIHPSIHTLEPHFLGHSWGVILKYYFSLSSSSVLLPILYLHPTSIIFAPHNHSGVEDLRKGICSGAKPAEVSCCTLRASPSPRSRPGKPVWWVVLRNRQHYVTVTWLPHGNQLMLELNGSHQYLATLIFDTNQLLYMSPLLVLSLIIASKYAISIAKILNKIFMW